MSRDTRADYSVPIDEGLDRYDQAEANAINSIAAKGLGLNAEPARWDDGRLFDGRIPSNLASLQMGDITTYHNLLIVHADYVNEQLVMGRAALETAKEKLAYVKAAVRKTKTGNAPQKADNTLVDDRYIQQNTAYIEARVVVELLEGIAKAASRDTAFVSRLYEAKKMEIEGNRRGESMSRGRGTRAYKRK